jgi:hypothetical protein
MNPSPTIPSTDKNGYLLAPEIVAGSGAALVGFLAAVTDQLRAAPVSAYGHAW